MSKKTLSIEGAAELAAALEASGRDVRKEFEDAIAKASHAIVANAKARAPVDDGDLIASIDDVISDGGLTAEAGSRGIRHSAFVEWGTSDTPAQPYLFPSFLEVAKPLRKELRAIVADIPLKVRTRIKRDPRTRK